MRTRDRRKAKLPNDLHLISLKYAGRCRECGKWLEVGEQAHWSRSSKSVWCVNCAHGDRLTARAEAGSTAGPSRRSARNAHTTHSSASSHPVDSTLTPWQQLCTYAQRCIEAEAANSLVPFVRQDSQWFLHRGAEQLVVGQGDATQVPVKLADKLESRKRPIIYGWPTVVVVDRDHMPKVAPMFAVPVEPERNPQGHWTIQATMEPEFNLAITASRLFDPSVEEDIGEMLSHGLPFGDAQAFAELAERTAGLLGLEILSPLAAGALESRIERSRGVYNAAISVVAEWSAFTRTLREELRYLRTRDDWASTAAAHLVPNGFVQKQGESSLAGRLAAPLACNHSQEQTLERFRKEPLTIVTGPPGTGKTQLVVNAATNSWLDGDRVLVTSTNNGAVDVAVARADRDVSSGLLIRTGNRNVREHLPARVTTASAQTAKHRGNQAQARAILMRTASDRTGLQEKLARMDELDAQMLQVVVERAEANNAQNEAAQALWTGAKPPELPMGSRALERRARQLMVTWWFRRWRMRRLRRRLGCLDTAPMKQLVTWAQLDQRINVLTSLLKQARTERQKLQSAVGDPSAELLEADRKWAEASLRAVRVDTATRIAFGANHLALFGTVPKHGDQFKRTIANSFDYLRGWACTALTANSNFPCKAGLFDLVIVDEASQCSLAAVLPLAYRAKRLAIVGDPYQLNPIVSLGDGLLKEIATQSGFENEDLRERGIHHKDGSAYAAFEFAARPKAPVLLNEHYRCHPHIARWFNRAFYMGELTVLTDVSDTSERDRAIYWLDIQGTAERPASGSWVNRAEASETVRQLHGVINSGYKTVGVVTPFTAQAQLIGQLAKRRFGEDFLSDIDFVSGTAHRLQGDERDAIILSSVLSPGMASSGIRWIEKERNLLNVAVSRARRALVVLGHPDIEELGSPTLASLRVYLSEEVTGSDDPGLSPAEFRTDSTSEQLLLDAMQLSELTPYAKLEVEGYELDFALLEQGIKLNVEVDGDQHIDARGRQRRQDITRDRVLARLGWTVLRIPAWRCQEEIDSVIEEISQSRDRLTLAH